MEKFTGEEVRDFLVMMKAPWEVTLFECGTLDGDRIVPNNIVPYQHDRGYIAMWHKDEMMADAIEEAICCVEKCYTEIAQKVGKLPENRWPVSTIRNRLKVSVNFFRQRVADSRYCEMMMEAIRCVELIGTGVPEPETISFEELQ